jgi:hypothetical protein
MKLPPVTRYQINRRRTDPPGAHRCCRPSKLGNPFTEKEFGRISAVFLFEIMIAPYVENLTNALRWANSRGRQHVLSEIARIAADPKITCLGCYCKLSDKCHVDIIIDRVNAIRAGKEKPCKK